MLLVLGALALVAAVAYTGWTFPYGYRGLGEVAVFCFFGLVAVAGTAYLQTGTWSALGFAAAIPVGALVTAILVVNNLRDIGPDARADKRTLAVMFGSTVRAARVPRPAGGRLPGAGHPGHRRRDRLPSTAVAPQPAAGSCRWCGS